MCNISILERTLALKKAESFDFVKISSKFVSFYKTKLLDQFEKIQKVHEKCLELHNKELNLTEREKSVKEDTEFISNISSKICHVLEDIKLYEESFDSFNRTKSLIKQKNETRGLVIQAKKELIFIQKAIRKEIDSIECKIS